MSARRLLAIGLGAIAFSAAAAPLPVEGTFAGFDARPRGSTARR
ncbi:hypothetical protein NX786_02415 [Telluria mixta]|uniref:Uncharacterized protein n=1 Tax=Telluria mixta TaxID=34071 RepID=A0ABT2BSU9_9BURK|nr:hypothetical protein [Telluria mixta]MCS0628198.1 hypothetical protein [Telluria mixta]WEM93688.1 hypothetical protein P0M04_19575 [Telluria mixta]